MAYRSTGKWGKQLLSDELDEGARLAQARTGMLAARVRDDTTRELTDKLKNRASDAIVARTPEDSERAEIDVTLIYTELNQRIGEVLRKLDDAEQVDLPASSTFNRKA
jgi:DNA-binding HxlR family transcriptional regulator